MIVRIILFNLLLALSVYCNSSVTLDHNYFGCNTNITELLQIKNAPSNSTICILEGKYEVNDFSIIVPICSTIKAVGNVVIYGNLSKKYPLFIFNPSMGDFCQNRISGIHFIDIANLSVSIISATFSSLEISDCIFENIDYKCGGNLVDVYYGQGFNLTNTKFHNISSDSSLLSINSQHIYITNCTFDSLMRFTHDFNQQIKKYEPYLIALQLKSESVNIYKIIVCNSERSFLIVDGSDYIDGGYLTIRDSAMYNNTADIGPFLMFYLNNVTMINTKILQTNLRKVDLMQCKDIIITTSVIYTQVTNLNIIDSIFEENWSCDSVLYILQPEEVYITNSNFKLNKGHCDWGIISILGQNGMTSENLVGHVLIENSTFIKSSNSSAILVQSTDLELINSTFSQNIYEEYNMSACIESEINTPHCPDQCGYGGALWINNDVGEYIRNPRNISVIIDKVKFIDNNALYYGGAICIETNLDSSSITMFVTNSYFQGNNATYGGAIAITTDSSETLLYINNSNSFNGNNAKRGGVFYSNVYSTWNLQNNNFTKNNADVSGGIIYLSPENFNEDTFFPTNSLTTVCENNFCNDNAAKIYGEHYASGPNKFNFDHKNKKHFYPGIPFIYNIEMKDIFNQTSKDLNATNPTGIITSNCTISRNINTTQIWDWVWKEGEMTLNMTVRGQFSGHSICKIDIEYDNTNTYNYMHWHSCPICYVYIDNNMCTACSAGQFTLLGDKCYSCEDLCPIERIRNEEPCPKDCSITPDIESSTWGIASFASQLTAVPYSSLNDFNFVNPRGLAYCETCTELSCIKNATGDIICPFNCPNGTVGRLCSNCEGFFFNIPSQCYSCNFFDVSPIYTTASVVFTVLGIVVLFFGSFSTSISRTTSITIIFGVATISVIFNTILIIVQDYSYVWLEALVSFSFFFGVMKFAASSPYLKTFLYYVQTMALLNTYFILSKNKEFEVYRQYTFYFPYSFKFASLQCVLSFAMLFSTSTACLVMVILLVIFFITGHIFAYYKNISGVKVNLSIFYSKCKFLLLFLVYIFYFPLAVESLSPLFCIKEDHTGHFSTDSYNAFEPTIKCRSQDHINMILKSLPGILLFFISPFVCTGFLFYYKHKRLDADVSIWLGFMYDSYEYKFWWFEGFAMKSKFLMALMLFLSNLLEMKIDIFIWVSLIINLCAVAYFKPFYVSVRNVILSLGKISFRVSPFVLGGGNIMYLFITLRLLWMSLFEILSVWVSWMIYVDYIIFILLFGLVFKDAIQKNSDKNEYTNIFTNEPNGSSLILSAVE